MTKAKVARRTVATLRQRCCSPPRPCRTASSKQEAGATACPARGS